MPNNYIKQIEVNGGTYDIYDEYARRRLEGLTSVYSISCEHTGSSSNTYVDYLTGDTITYSTMAIANSQFKPTSLPIPDDITITKTTGKTTYIVLTSKTTGGAYYALRFLDMELGDTVYVVERTTTIGTETVSIPDRWLSGAVADTSATFTILDGKIDLKEYAKKTEAGKAGTYTTTNQTPTVSGSGGAQTAIGSATVTYSKAATVTGSAGGETVTSAAGGAVSITYTPSGSISGSQSIGAHSHTVNLTKETITYVDSVTNQTGSAGAHTHSVSVSGDVSLGDMDIKVGTGTANYTPSGSLNIVVDNHSYQPEGTVSPVSAASHSHTIDSHTHGTNVGASKINSYTAPSMTTISFTANGNDSYTAPAFSSTESYTPTGPNCYVCNPTVNNNVLSLSINTFNAGTFTQGSKATLTGGVFSAGTFTYSAVTAAGAPSAATLSSSSSGAFTVTPTFTGTTATLSHNVSTKSFTGTGVRLQVGGGTVSGTMTGTAASAGAHTHSITASTATFNNVTGATTSDGGSHTVDFTKATFTGATATLTQAAHTHGVTTSSHTHTIELSDATATGSASVAVSNHTHSIGHTHDVVIPNCA